MSNPRFPSPTKEQIDKYKLRFSTPKFKNTFVSSGLSRRYNNVIIPMTTNDSSSSSCESNDVQGATSLNINQLYTAYQFNNIQNQTYNTKPLIAIVDYDAAVNLQSSMDSFCETNNIPSTTLNIVPVQNPPSTTDGEQYADTQLVHSFCINADIVVVQASSSNIEDMAVAIQVAESYNPNVINMSWSVDESTFTQDEYNNLSTLFTGNIIYCASSGDDGSSYVSWPCSDPNVVAVGATTLVLNSDNSISSQVAWSCCGCGPSQFSSQPAYQSVVNTGTTFRATPDISFDGNPYSGIQLNINGTTETIGGTSVAAPMMSGFFGSVNGSLLNSGGALYTSIATSAECIQTLLYNAVNQSDYNTLYYDVTQGSVGQYNAGVGWDYPSGCGTFFGSAMQNYLISSASPASGGSSDEEVNNTEPNTNNNNNNNNGNDVSVNNDTDQVQQPSFSASQIVSRPRLWPVSFAKPELSQKVCVKTYIFKNGSDIQKFVKFVKESFPNYVIDIKENKDGSTSVSLTSTNTSSSNDVGKAVYGINYPGSCILTKCFKKEYIYSREPFYSGFLIWKTCKSKTNLMCISDTIYF